MKDWKFKATADSLKDDDESAFVVIPCVLLMRQNNRMDTAYLVAIGWFFWSITVGVEIKKGGDQ